MNSPTRITNTFFTHHELKRFKFDDDSVVEQSLVCDRSGDGSHRHECRETIYLPGEENGIPFTRRDHLKHRELIEAFDEREFDNASKGTVTVTEYAAPVRHEYEPVGRNTRRLAAAMITFVMIITCVMAAMVVIVGFANGSV